MIDNNSNNANGGGIYVGGAGGGLNLTNVTLSGNSASVGGGVYNEISSSLVNVTVTNNSATQSGGLAGRQRSNDSVRNTIIAGNTGGNPDGNGSFDSLGYNIIGVVGGSTGWIGSDRTGVDPLLQALADNGGPTPTHALAAGSQAIDNGTTSGAPAADQRGVARDGSPDIGAYEYVAVNSAPTADAGGAYTITEGNSLVLDGSGSSDPDADSLTYAWDLDNDLGYGDTTGVGPTVTWATLQTYGITAPGSYTIGLQVDDGNGHTDTDTASLTVDPAPTTVVVNSTGDGSDATPGDGVCDTGGTNSEGADECTLRAAIEEANATATVDTIEFSLPVSDPAHSSGVWTIAVASKLPGISDAVTIDGTTQPGATANSSAFPANLNSSLAIRLSGALLTGSNEDGLALNTGSDGSVIRGLSITDFDDYNDEAIVIWNSSNNVVTGNHLGVDPSGATAAGNTAGVWIGLNSVDNRIGGTTPAERNLLAGNSALAIGSSGTGATGTLIQGNDIGVLANGGAAGNGPNAIVIYGGATATVGGTAAGAGNRIANSGVGVALGISASDAEVTILGNRIWDDSSLGIDIGGDGVTVNDAGDGDTGANDLLNFPEITSAVEVGGTVYVDFDLDVPAGDYRIELFTNAAGDPTGYGEGENFVSSYAVPSHPGGSVSYSTSFAGATGDIITATATKDLGGGSYGGTSEFSAFVVVVADTEAPVITLLGSNPQTIEAGASYVELGATATDDVEGDVSGSIVIDASAVNTSVLGSYSVTYDVTDSSGNPAVQATRTVDVVDTTAPVISLVGSNPQTIEVGGSYIELGATASGQLSTVTFLVRS